jgi:hypothetical protein
MNPYASDIQEQQPPMEQLPPGLSFGTILATLIMLVFGLSGLMGIFGVIISLIQLAAPNAMVVGQPPAATTTEDQDEVDSDVPLNNRRAGPNPLQQSPAQIGVQAGIGIVDFLLAVPMVLWSIQVFQRKRPAALKLSGLALLMAILQIPRGIYSYFFLPEIMNGLKQGVASGMEQQNRGQRQLQPEEMDSVFQVMTYSMLGCVGIMLVFLFLIYLFCYFQLRKPTTLARLTD